MLKEALGHLEAEHVDPSYERDGAHDRPRRRENGSVRAKGMVRVRLGFGIVFGAIVFKNHHRSTGPHPRPPPPTPTTHKGVGGSK